MVMKWFTREYVTGQLSDEEWERRRSGYALHVKAVEPLLGDGAEKLIGEVNLHDAQVRDWQLGANGDFALSMLVGDLQRGYEWLTLKYLGADLIGVTQDGLSALGLTDVGVELIYDEVDVLVDGRYEHRILAWPDGEFGVRFRSLRVRRETASASDRRFGT